MSRAAWTTNDDWRAEHDERGHVNGERCGRVSDRFLPCPNRRPCPVHDVAPASPPLPRLEPLEPFEAER